MHLVASVRPPVRLPVCLFALFPAAAVWRWIRFWLCIGYHRKLLQPPGVVFVKKHNRPSGPLMATRSWSTSTPTLKCPVHTIFGFAMNPPNNIIISTPQPICIFSTIINGKKLFNA